MPPKIVSILGCGWLGFPLAQKLIGLGFAVRGSVLAPDKLPLLQKEGIDPYVIRCDPKLTGERLNDFFQADILVITLPFLRDLPNPQIYQEQIDSVMTRAESSSIRFVVFTGSTSIYPDDMKVAREDDRFVPGNPRAAVLAHIEQNLLANRVFAATVLRIGGLYGADRPIGRFSAGQKNLSSGSQPVNLVHRDDCVEIMSRIIAADVRGEIFNVVSDAHPTRRELYSLAAKARGEPLPVFGSDLAASGKIVSNRKVKEQLGYQFRYPDPLEFVKREAGRAGA